MGGGSLGGKARGLAFVRRLLAEQGLRDRFPGVEIAVPTSAVLGTDVFDRFLDDNDLRYFAIECEDDAEIQERFRAASFPAEAEQDVAAFLERAQLAAGGALVEPARGLAAPAVHRRLRHADAGEQRLEPGRAAGPRRAGDQARLRLDLLAAREGLPAGDTLPPGGGEDGRDPPAHRGRGRTGRASTRTSRASRARTTSTRRRRSPPATGSWRWRSGWGGRSSKAARACASARAIPAASSSSRRSRRCSRRRSASSGRFRSRAAARTLACARRPSTSRPRRPTARWPRSAPPTRRRTRRSTTASRGPGPRLVTFAPVLKHGVFPLPEVLATLMAAGESGMGIPVEIEFAVSPGRRPRAGRREFGFVQMRPLALMRETEALEIGDVGRRHAAVPQPARARKRAARGHPGPRGRGLPALRALEEPGGGGRGRAPQRGARRLAHALRSRRRGALGLAGSVARDPGHLGPGCRSAGDRGGGAARPRASRPRRAPTSSRT